MKVLVVGGGGREHALAWKLSQEGVQVAACPGNPGMAQVADVYPDVDANDPNKLVELAKSLAVDFVLFGPEAPLIAGLADKVREAGLDVFGPGAEGAKLEGSKAFAKQMMQEAAIPTAEFQVFNESEPAKAFAKRMFDEGRQCAVKASGEALGKGVTVCDSYAMAEDAIEEAMVEEVFGEAGKTLVIEERLKGREFSLLTLVSGERYRSLPVAQDYKRALDGDRGPNTGGMGTYSPVEWLSPDEVTAAEEAAVAPLLRKLAERGVPFRGVLFTGFMVQANQPYVLEYNVRFGDPEIQSVVRRLGGGFAEALRAVAAGEEIPEIEVKKNAAVSVVLASAGYPGKYTKGHEVTIGEMGEHAQVFHAGTAFKDGKLVTSGGRVVAVTAEADTLGIARHLAYEAAKKVEFEGKQFRTDIATG